jgi:hypothetical protein
VKPLYESSAIRRETLRQARIEFNNTQPTARAIADAEAFEANARTF